MPQSEEYDLNTNEMEHYKKVMENLNVMRNDETTCDFIIGVGKETIHVHKHIVRAASDYFDAIFSHDTVEKEQGIVHMKDVEYFAVRKCVDFMYTGKLSLSFEQCVDVLSSANLMQLDDACNAISSFLEGHVNLDSFFAIRQIALKFSLGSLQEFCDEFAASRFIAFSKLKEFNDIDVSYFKMLLSWIDSTATTMEDAKLAAVIQWVRSNQDYRTANLPELLNLIDVTKLTLGYCFYLVEEEPLCKTSINLMRMLFSAVAPSDKVTSRGPPNAEDEVLPHNALIIFDKDKRKLLSYFPTKSIVHNLADFNDCMSAVDISACSTPDRLFAFTCNGRFLIFDYDDRKWIDSHPLQRYHGHSLRCVIHNNCVYVGGFDTVEKLKMVTGSEWEDVDLNGNLCDLSAMVEYNGRLYLIGGKTQDRDCTVAIPVNNVVCQFPNTNWRSVSPMHVERMDANAVVFDGNIYVAGGIDNDSTVDQFELYNDKTNVWTILKCGIYPSSDFSLHVVSNKIFAVGGDCARVYDFNDHTWKDVDGFKLKNVAWFGTTTASLPLPELT